MSRQPNQHTLVDPRLIEQERLRRFLRLKHCARELGCSVGHIRGLIDSGKLGTYELDGLLLVAVVEWDRYLDTAKPTKRKRITAVKSA